MPHWLLTNTTDPSLVLRVMPGTTKTLGRGARADFVVDAALLSRVHCRLVADASGQLAVEDLDSTNGVAVNGEPVDRAVLKPGDTLTIGRVAFAVALDGAS